MDTKDIVPAILLFVLVGLLLGVGIFTLDIFSRSVRTTTTGVTTGINMSSTTSIDLTETYCLSGVSITNTSGTSWSITTYNLTLTNADGCVFTWSANTGCSLPYCNITYTYGQDNTAASSMVSTNTALAPISATWLPLIITVVALSIIMGLVIRSFSMGDRN